MRINCMSPELWEHEAQEVKLNYPDADLREVSIGGQRTWAWRLTMIPIPDEAELHDILADLSEGRMVCIGLQGRIYHSSICELPAENHPTLFPYIKLNQQVYLVELIYRPPNKKASWSTQPIARIINPEISVRTYPNHPHMYYGNGSWACPLSPQEKSWIWDKGATIAYLDQVSIWLLKTAVWIATGAGIAGLGKWIGPDTSHEPLSLINTINPDDPCWCGSGVYYHKCHQKSDMQQAIRKRIIELR